MQRDIRYWAGHGVGDVVTDVVCPAGIEPKTHSEFHCIVTLADGSKNPVVVRYTADQVKWTWDPLIASGEWMTKQVGRWTSTQGLSLTRVDCGRGVRRYQLGTELCSALDRDGKRRSIVMQNNREGVAELRLAD